MSVRTTLRKNKNLLSAGLASLAVLAVVPPGASGAAPAPQAEAHNRARHCITVLEKPAPGERTSRVAERKCTREGESLAQLRGRMAPRELLVKYWDGTYFDGDSDEIRGRDGGCDAGGYGVPDMGAFKNRVSSFRTFGTCNSVQLFDNPSYDGAQKTFEPPQWNPVQGTNGLHPFDNRADSLWLRAV
ncbi:hypothetical protein [Streptomyces atriruber]|uniref:hypothetical protein n=1 Tax=Streptomyces atriruber TaxID=545121 RepID=UPI0006E384B4|nr:hypothetical protein [Streptomyces atriruber]